MTTTRTPDIKHDNQPDAIDSHQASQRLGITEDAIRKRIARGTLEGYKEDGRWWVQVPDNSQSQPETDRTDGTIAAMGARIESLETQLTTKDQQIDQLHRLLAQTALKETPARPWWRFW